jgi:diaminopropionate ammonia-lyase
MLSSARPVRFFLNPRANPGLSYGTEQREVLREATHDEAFLEVSSWESYAPTPLRSLDGLAGKLGIASLLYKDEGTRLGLGSFKALGGIYGVFRVVQGFLEEKTGEAAMGSADLARGGLSRILSTLTVTCASAGNHGRAVARGAQMFGCRSVIFLPASTSRHRRAAIERLEARTVPVEGAFDDAVAQAAAEASREGWRVVADTTYPGYEEVPRSIMQGYSILAREVLEQLAGGPPPTHVFLQAGVGGLAAAVTGYFWERLGRERPKVVVVEPAEADGLLESALHDRPTPSCGSLRTSLECLACRRVSGPAWSILRTGADAFLTLDDHAAEETVELLARGPCGDPPIRTQTSGAAGLAGLTAATFEPALSEPLGLGADSRVLVIGSEGPP